MQNMQNQRSEIAKLRVLDLFSGIGGFSLGLESTGHYQTAMFCENDPFCQGILRTHWKEVPIHDDIKTLRIAECGIGPIDVVCGGFPCQPYSVAGHRQGDRDDRSLWESMFRVVRETGPTWVIGENVPGLIGLALDAVLSDLESVGYDCRAIVLPACAVDAPHRRNRLWIVAHLLPDPDGERLQLDDGGSGYRQRAITGQAKPGLDGMVDGLPAWLDEPQWIKKTTTDNKNRARRIKALGNSVVPQLVAQIGLIVATIHEEGRKCHGQKN